MTNGGAGQEVERDSERLYHAGRLAREALTVYTYLVDHPAQPTRDLRRGTHLRDSSLAAATERALAELQRRFLVCKVGLTGRTRRTYSYIWDLAERFWPEAFEDTGTMTVASARAHIRQRLRACGLLPDPAVEARLFLWR